MGREFSIAISAKDNFSQAITTMRNANQHFNKDLEGMQEKLDAINKTKTILKLDTGEAKKNLTALQKEYEAAKKTGDGMISDELLKKLDEANEAYEQARRNLSLLDKEAKITEKSMTDMGGALSKLESRAGISGGAKEGFWGGIASAGAFKLAGDTLTNVAQTFVGSMGDDASTLFSSLLSGASSGAAVGTVFGGGPGIGTAFGAVAGAGTGLINGATQIFSKEDTAFKGYVQEQYGSVQQYQEDTIVVREDADIDRIASELARKLKEQQMVS